MAKIIANRNGQTREFDEVIWNNMPPNHYGWVQAAETPKEVQDILDKNVKSIEVTIPGDIGNSIQDNTGSQPALEPVQAAETPKEVQDDTKPESEKASEVNTEEAPTKGRKSK